ncbi:BDH1-stereospecific (2R 3R)-23-butanediol dehydrogenase [Pyrenophora seminiperda CCB06]|uniref:BDH1-stereospecific (2R 3R)-23-butanediol dehydrogenase n=1 Tax=Pyrenophora seminiperda CCB06 TaxID=1302712 RepID=A0A3M7MA17_9PLEO|nr:BDH1-stereospecific (2R 3R)-23-butanediol dehydrogenase [Pyrenophora seminiperda CCB06]
MGIKNWGDQTRDSENMRAARYHGQEDIRIEDVDEQKCGAGQVRIAPAFVGICGTDLHEYLGGPTFAPRTPHPCTNETIPITLGHEFSGTVTEVGSADSAFTVGQNVVVQPTIYCGTCEACTAGSENVCYNGGFIGLSGGGGGLSGSVVVPEGAVLSLPNNVPLDIGALVEPLSVAWHAVSAAPITPDSVVMILGGGPIGLAIVQCLVAIGTRKIIVSEISSSRQRFAREFGAHHVICPKTYDVAQMGKVLSNSDGPDVVFDCAGVPASLTTACTAVRARGTVVNVAIWEKEVPFNPNLLVIREAKYMAVLGYQRHDFQAVIDLLAAGKLNPSKMITSKIQLEDLVEHGIKALINDKESHVKILVEVGGMSRIDSAVAGDMSQYNHMPPPGPYIPPNQGAPAQQGHTPHQYNTTSYGASNQTQKGAGGFGQMMNQRLEQAVTTGKPMLNKLGNAISSKLGNKPSPGSPRPPQNYHNYQNQYGQQNQAHTYQQPQGQTFSPPPPPQQQNWGHPPPPPSNASPATQHSPYQQPNYSTPTSGPPASSNYFPQQTNQPPAAQAYAPQSPPLTSPGYNQSQYSQGGSPGGQMQTQGQYGQGQGMQVYPSAPFQTPNQVQNHHTGHQVGVIGGSQSVQNIASPHTSCVSPVAGTQPIQPQWGHPSGEQMSGGVIQPQADVPTKPLPPYSPAPSPLGQKEQNEQQVWNSWNNASPANNPTQRHSQMLPASVNPLATHQWDVAPQLPSNKPVHSISLPGSPPHDGGPHSAPAEFIAELPGDMGSLTLLESKPQTPSLGNAGSPYQAYRPSGSSPSPGHSPSLQTQNGNNRPLGDPWRFANITTETPTREFYILADLLFDALDQKFEPRHTGLLEAPKVLGGWVRLTDDARRLFSYNSYSAFAKLWSLEGIPHMMVPCEAALAPNWKFDQGMHAREIQVSQDPPTSFSRYATYMPALNRAGWYKFFFLEMMHAPDDLEALVPALCADTYKPGVQHPDIHKRDRTEMGGLQSRAAAIKTFAMQRVCEETKATMTEDPNGRTHTGAGSW